MAGLARWFSGSQPDLETPSVATARPCGRSSAHGQSSPRLWHRSVVSFRQHRAAESRCVGLPHGDWCPPGSRVGLVLRKESSLPWWGHPAVRPRGVQALLCFWSVSHRPSSPLQQVHSGSCPLLTRTTSEQEEEVCPRPWADHRWTGLLGVCCVWLCPGRAGPGELVRRSWQAGRVSGALGCSDTSGRASPKSTWRRRASQELAHLSVGRIEGEMEDRRRERPRKEAGIADP